MLGLVEKRIKIEMASGPGSLSFSILEGTAYGREGKRKGKKDVEVLLTNTWQGWVTGKKKQQ